LSINLQRTVIETPTLVGTDRKVVRSRLTFRTTFEVKRLKVNFITPLWEWVAYRGSAFVAAALQPHSLSLSLMLLRIHFDVHVHNKKLS